MAQWEFILTGSGTSTGVPQAGCDCAVCRSPDPRNRRQRAAGLFRRLPSSSPPSDGDGGNGAAGARASEPAAVVIDAGMDFRAQLLAARVMRLDAVVFTHDHIDHIGGLDDVRPYGFYQQAPIPVFAAPDTLASVRRRYDYIWNAPQPGGGLPRIELHAIDGPFTAGGLPLEPLPVRHGVLDILGFRAGDLGYVTDASFIPESTLARLEGVRWLVLGAAQHAPHTTHFNVERAVETARRVGARLTVLTHMNHALDYATLSRELPYGVCPGYDGLRLVVTCRDGCVFP